MNYSDQPDEMDAGEQLTESDVESPSEGYSFFLPPEMPGSENMKAGDTIQLKVIGKSADGELEVKRLEVPEEAGDMMSDLRTSMARPGTQKGII